MQRAGLEFLNEENRGMVRQDLEAMELGVPHEWAGTEGHSVMDPTAFSDGPNNNT